MLHPIYSMFPGRKYPVGSQPWNPLQSGWCAHILIYIYCLLWEVSWLKTQQLQAPSTQYLKEAQPGDGSSGCLFSAVQVMASWLQPGPEKDADNFCSAVKQILCKQYLHVFWGLKKKWKDRSPTGKFITYTWTKTISTSQARSLENIQKDTKCTMSEKGKLLFLFGPLKHLQIPAAAEI